MRTLLSIIILLVLHINALGQQDVKVLSPIISKAEKIVLIIYSNYKDQNNIRSMVLKGEIDSLISNSGFKLDPIDRTKLTSILTNPKTFHGRYSTCRGCLPSQALLMWHDGKYSLIEFNTSSYKALYSKSENYFVMNKYKRDALIDFFKKYKTSK